jgi:tRNA G10  N-methylase Trm11
MSVNEFIERENRHIAELAKEEIEAVRRMERAREMVKQAGAELVANELASAADSLRMIRERIVESGHTLRWIAKYGHSA